jgi:hypothetical protein
MNDVSHLYPQKTTLVRPTDEIEINYYFHPEKVYTIDGWYFCPETDGEWYLCNARTIFTLDRVHDTLGKLYWCSLTASILTKEECEKLLTLKMFW